MNIILTNECNLDCKYCFAKSFLKQEKQEITIKDFKYLLDFCNRSGEKMLGLMGGEPTMHKDFRILLHLAINRSHAEKIVLLTNGIFNNQILKDIIIESRSIKSSEKVLGLLVNYNTHPINRTELKVLVENNIILLKKEKVNINLGINIYDKNQNVEGIISFADSANITEIRWTIVVPEFIKTKNIRNHFESLLPVLDTFIEKAYKKNIKLHPDCSNLPICMLPKSLFDKITSKYPNTFKSIACMPIIDVKPDLTAIRCFMVSDYSVNIKNFRNIDDIIEHFILNIDRKVRNYEYIDRDADCAFIKMNHGSCLCLGYLKP